jgi:hypothetical protein
MARRPVGIAVAHIPTQVPTGFRAASTGYRLTMDERSSDTEETFSSQGPPSDVSGQNAEESEAPSGGDGQSSGGGESNPQTEGGREGGGGEESQATGNPSNAG